MVVADRVSIADFSWTWSDRWFWAGTQLWQVFDLCMTILLIIEPLLDAFMIVYIYMLHFALQTLWFAWTEWVWKIHSSYRNWLPRASYPWTHGYLSPLEGDRGFRHDFTRGCHKLWWGEVEVGERSWSIGRTGVSEWLINIVLYILLWSGIQL